MRRTFDLDLLECPKCTGKLRILALIDDPTIATQILDKRNRSSEEPRITTWTRLARLQTNAGRQIDFVRALEIHLDVASHSSAAQGRPWDPRDEVLAAAEAAALTQHPFAYALASGPSQQSLTAINSFAHAECIALGSEQLSWFCRH